jgi:hypothetical protein
MGIKSPQMLSAGVKAVRGIGSEWRLDRFDKFASIDRLALDDAVGVKQGESAVVPVAALDNMPINADIETLIAELEVVGDHDAPASVGDGLQNIQLRLDQGEIFWRYGGLLKPGKYEISNFAESANAYLDKLNPKDEKVIFRFLVNSDTPGKVRIKIKEQKFSLIHTQTWRNELDDTIRVDRNLEMDFSQLAIIPVDPIEAPTGRKIKRSSIKMDVGGQFTPERLLGFMERHNTVEHAVVSSDYSLAQRFRLNKELVKTSILSVGVSCLFLTDEEAEIYMEIQPDANGIPAMETPLGAGSTLLSAKDKDEAQIWASVLFKGPVVLKADIPYWVVIKGVQGKTRVGLLTDTRQDKPVSAVYRDVLAVNRGGKMWKNLIRRQPSLPSTPDTEALQKETVTQALLGLIYLPDSDNQTAAIQIEVEGIPITQRVELEAEAKPISFDLKSSDISQAILVVRSSARGTFSIANIIQEYSLT